MALTPDAVRRLVSDEVTCAVQSGAGARAHFSDDEYREAGAEVAADAAEAYAGADVVLKVAPPAEIADAGRHEVDALPEGAALIGFLRPHGNEAVLRRLADRRITAFALELMPRITRAQSMDALSSQANLAGYRAVLLGASSLGKLFPLMMTAAGTLRPADVLVLGAGVAGLQAIATARRLGAVVRAYDIRPVVKEEVESLGATFVVLEEEEVEEGKAAAGSRQTEGGYARELDESEQERQRRLMTPHVARSDVVITTALVPGRPAPLLITGAMVREMDAGSVIVDLAAEEGGNCELSEPGRSLERHGVLIHAPLNLPASLPVHASQMYARNVSSLLQHLSSGGSLAVDLEDEIADACCVTHGGEVRWSP